jgi:hypothetical protein
MSRFDRAALCAVLAFTAVVSSGAEPAFKPKYDSLTT